MRTVSVLVADLEGSDTLPEYDLLLDRVAAEHGGMREPGAGDARLLAFDSARAAVEAAVALQRGTGELRVRVGLHTGELERRDGELRGRALVKAARIAALARGGEILASSVVRELADLNAFDGDVWFDDGDEVELRGLRGRHVLSPVRWEASTTHPPAHCRSTSSVGTRESSVEAQPVAPRTPRRRRPRRGRVQPPVPRPATPVDPSDPAGV